MKALKFIGVLGVALLAQNAMAMGKCYVGERVGTKFNGQWFAGEVVDTASNHTRCLVNFYKGQTRWVEASRLMSADQAGGGDPRDFAIGDIVLVQRRGIWEQASILKIDGNRYKVHYNGTENYMDEWVSASQIRVR